MVMTMNMNHSSSGKTLLIMNLLVHTLLFDIRYSDMEMDKTTLNYTHTHTQTTCHIYKPLSCFLVFQEQTHPQHSIFSSRHHLVTSLNVSIQAVEFLPVLGHYSTNNISDGHHSNHVLIINDRNVPDAVIYRTFQIPGQARGNH